MPLSKSGFIWSTAAFILIGMLALLSIVGATFWLVSQQQTYADQVTRGRQIRISLVQLRSDLQDAETAQRGFLLTQDPSYLEPYDRAREALTRRFTQVRTLLGDDSQALGVLARLQEASDAKLTEMKETIDLAEAGKPAGALAIVRTGRGKMIMDEARRLFDTLLGGAEDMLNDSVRGQQDSVSALRWATMAAALLILVVCGGAAWIIVTYTMQLTRAQRDVHLLNDQLEQRVLDRTRDLTHANAETQRFAYVVTHDLRAPLVNIMGFTSELETSLKALQALTDRVPADGDDVVAQEARRAAAEDLPEAIDFIRSSTRKMDGLINAILKLSREGRRTLKPEPVALEDLLKAAAAAIQHQVLQADGTVDIQVDLPRIISDRLALEQIVGNLLDNAVKYRQPDRPLTIHIAVKPAERHRVAIEIEDNGRGITQQDHERVFEPFRRSGPQDQPGEGIGLSYVRATVRALGGEITLSSVLNRGTKFTINLPRVWRADAGSLA